MAAQLNKSAVTFVVASIGLFVPVHVSAREIKDVTVLRYGLTSSKDDRLAEECKRFKPTKKQVRTFFLSAYSVPQYFGSHDRYAPCYATGTIVFDDFGEARWTITSGGVASLIWSEGDTVDLYKKNNGWFDPTACTYGLGDKGEC